MDEVTYREIIPMAFTMGSLFLGMGIGVSSYISYLRNESFYKSLPERLRAYGEMMDKPGMQQYIAQRQDFAKHLLGEFPDMDDRSLEDKISIVFGDFNPDFHLRQK